MLGGGQWSGVRPVSGDVILAGGLVIDGTGSEGRIGDVVIRDGYVLSLNEDTGDDCPPGVERRDVRGLIVCPGFVDIHTHSDLTLLSAPSAPSKIRQGVTTEVVGNCGLACAPLPPGSDRQALRQAVSYLDLDPAVPWAWDDVAGYLATLETAHPVLNVATFVGHLPLHAGVVGFSDASASAADRRSMVQLLNQALADGAVGLSTGLVYAPLPAVDAVELRTLAEAVAANGKLFAWHLRSYDDDLLSSVREAIGVARDTGVRTQISHLTAVGKRNWAYLAQALDLVDCALQDDGLDLGIDIYPYLFGNAPLAQILPTWAQLGTAAEWRPRLLDPAVRTRVRAAWHDRPVSWDEIIVSWTRDTGSAAVGRTLGELAASSSSDGAEAALDLLAEFGSDVMIIAGGRSDTELRRVLSHPACVVASDGFSLDPSGITGGGVPHPRSYGCFPRYLSQYVMPMVDGDSITQALPDGIRRCTQAPAERVGLDRGVLRPGAVADITVLDPTRLADRTTLTDSQCFPDGIPYVLVAGAFAVDGGQPTEEHVGRVLRVPNPKLEERTLD